MATKASGPFIVVSGDEDFAQDRFVSRRKQAWKKRQIIVRDGSQISETELITLCESRSFFEDDAGRAIFLDNAQDLKLDKNFEQYVEEKDSSDDSMLLVAVVRGSKLSAAWTKASKKGVLVTFSKLKPWETEKAVSRVTEEASALGLKLDQGVADMIFRYIGDDLRTTVNELVKLSYLTGDDKLVKKDHVASVLVSSVEVEPRQVAEAALAKNRQLASTRLSKLFKASGDSACVPIVMSCLYQVEKVLVARQMMDHGDGTSLIAQRLGMNEYACKLNIIPLAHKHTSKFLLGQMEKLCKLDAQVKGAARSKRTLVELAVLSIAV